MMNTSEILPNLFVGSYPQSPEDIDRLCRAGITAVLNAQTDDDMAYCGVNWSRLESYYREVGVEVRRVPITDFDHNDLQCQLPKCVEVLDDLLRQGRTAYVHCNMGINRSPSIVIAYLHWILGWDLEKAANHVMERRSCDPYLDAIELAGEDRKKKK